MQKNNLRRYLQNTRDYVQMGWCRNTLFRSGQKEINTGHGTINSCRWKKVPLEVRKQATNCCLEGAILLATPTVELARKVESYLTDYLVKNNIISEYEELNEFNDSKKDKRSILRVLDKAIASTYQNS